MSSYRWQPLITGTSNADRAYTTDRGCNGNERKDCWDGSECRRTVPAFLRLKKLLDRQALGSTPGGLWLGKIQLLLEADRRGLPLLCEAARQLVLMEVPAVPSRRRVSFGHRPLLR